MQLGGVAAVLSVCTAAGKCIKVTKEFLEENGWYLLGKGLEVKEKVFQYGLLAEELKMAIQLLGEFDATVEELKRIQVQNDVKICALSTAENVSKQTHDVLKNFEASTVNTALMRKDPEYYRSLLHTRLGYLHAAMTSLHQRSQKVVRDIKSAMRIEDADQRQRQLQQIRSRYSTC